VDGRGLARPPSRLRRFGGTTFAHDFAKVGRDSHCLDERPRGGRMADAGEVVDGTRTLNDRPRGGRMADAGEVVDGTRTV
jgi:hypothetical protein